MKRAELEKLGLTKEQIDDVMDINGKDIEAAKGNLTAVTAERDNLKNELTTRDKQLEDLKASSGNAEELKKQIETLQADNKAKDEAHAAEIKRIQVENAVTLAIANAKGKNAKAIRALLDLENAEIAEDGSIKGLKEQIEALKKAEDSKFLFGSDVPEMKGAKPGESRDYNFAKPIDYSKMSYDEIAAAMENN